PRERALTVRRSSNRATCLRSGRLIQLIVRLGGARRPRMLLQIAHHGLLEVIRARAGGAGYQKYPSLPPQPANDILGPALGLFGLEQIDFVDEQPAFLDREIGGKFLEFGDDGAGVLDR